MTYSLEGFSSSHRVSTPRFDRNRRQGAAPHAWFSPNSWHRILPRGSRTSRSKFKQKPRSSARCQSWSPVSGTPGTAPRRHPLHVAGDPAPARSGGSPKLMPQRRSGPLSVACQTSWLAAPLPPIPGAPRPAPASRREPQALQRVSPRHRRMAERHAHDSRRNNSALLPIRRLAVVPAVSASIAGRRTPSPSRRQADRTPGNCRASRSSARYRLSCAVAISTAAATPVSFAARRVTASALQVLGSIR